MNPLATRVMATTSAAAAHSNKDIDETLKAFEETKKKLDAGAYKAVDIPDMAEVI